MINSLLNIALPLVFLIAIIAFLLARRIDLKCPNCHSRKRAKTGNTKEIDKSRWIVLYGPLHDHEIEYECKKCGKKYWSSIERVYP